MGKGQFGFVHGAQASAEKKLGGGTTVVYTKTRVDDGFIYDCECRCGDTSVKISCQSSVGELAPEEVETPPRFVEFVANGKI